MMLLYPETVRKRESSVVCGDGKLAFNTTATNKTRPYSCNVETIENYVVLSTLSAQELLVYTNGACFERLFQYLHSWFSGYRSIDGLCAFGLVI